MQTLPSHSLYEEVKYYPEAFWAKQAECLDWFYPWEKVLKWEPPYAEWFVGGKLNACYNCIDRHLQSETRYKTALFWEGEDGQERKYTYEELYVEVSKFSNVLKSLGVKKGDRVAIYLPLIPEAIIAILSCARIGAIHTVVFGGFSSESLKERILDAEATLVITADGAKRRGKVIPLKESVDIAISDCPTVQHVIVVDHLKQSIPFDPSRDHDYHDLMQLALPNCPAEKMDAEDILFILYTSGSTGKPKGIVHTTGGYMVGVTLSTR